MNMYSLEITFSVVIEVHTSNNYSLIKQLTGLFDVSLTYPVQYTLV